MSRNVKKRTFLVVAMVVACAFAATNVFASFLCADLLGNLSFNEFFLRKAQASGTGIPENAVLLEAESFADIGGWSVDTQFVEQMGSTYLIAHGKGKSVANAKTTANFPMVGNYRLWVRTKNWASKDNSYAGKFKVLLAGAEVSTEFGTVDSEWVWQDGGTVTISSTSTEVQLEDLTGFNGRCDALFFTTDASYTPPSDLTELTPWRRAILALPDVPTATEDFDLVIVGGGVAGCAAALAAARQGMKVALIQDRPVLGGNLSAEIRVPLDGSSFGQRIKIVDEITGTNDAGRKALLESNQNISLFLNWRAFRANTEGTKITSVDARQVKTGEEKRFTSGLFIDSTGDGWVGYFANADYSIGREARNVYDESMAPETADMGILGSSILWASSAESGYQFPEVPWAMDVAGSTSLATGAWNFEYGSGLHGLDPINDSEEIRDYLLKAMYGSFYNETRNNNNRDLNNNVSYVLGKRESRRLLGDHILTQNDILNRTVFKDSIAVGNWYIDEHVPPTEAPYFIYESAKGTAKYNGRYYIPFRSLYSRNIENLLMAGRDFSATHMALCGPRVMAITGQMGVAAGMGAYLANKYETTPRGVYEGHINELQSLVQFELPVDNKDVGVTYSQTWTSRTTPTGFFGDTGLGGSNGLQYIGGDYVTTNVAGNWAKFTPDIPTTGYYDVYMRWISGADRSNAVPIEIKYSGGIDNTKTVNQTLSGPTVEKDDKWNSWNYWYKVGTYHFNDNDEGYVKIIGASSGVTAVDAVSFVAVPEPEPEPEPTPTPEPTPEPEPTPPADVTVLASDNRGLSDAINLNTTDSDNVYLEPVVTSGASYWARFTVDFSKFYETVPGDANTFKLLPPNVIELEFANGGTDEHAQPFNLYVDKKNGDLFNNFESKKTSQFIDKIHTYGTGSSTTFKIASGNICELNKYEVTDGEETVDSYEYDIYIEWADPNNTGNLKAIHLKHYNPLGKDMVVPIFEYSDKTSSKLVTEGSNGDKLYLNNNARYSHALYYVDFDNVKAPINKVEFCYSSTATATREWMLFLDAPGTSLGGTLIATIDTSKCSTGHLANYRWHTMKITDTSKLKLKGKRKLYFYGNHTGTGNFGALRFISDNEDGENKSIYLSGLRFNGTNANDAKIEHKGMVRRTIERYPKPASNTKMYLGSYASSKPSNGTNWILAEEVDFGTAKPVDTVDFEIGVPNKFAGKKISIYLDAPPEGVKDGDDGDGNQITGTKIAELTTAATGGYATYTRQSAPLLTGPIEGKRKVYICLDPNEDVNNYSYVLRSVFFYKKTEVDLEKVEITKSDGSVVTVDGEMEYDVPSELSNIKLQFSLDDDAKINVGSLQDIALKKEDGNAVTTTGSYDEETKTYTLKIDDTLEIDKIYTLNISPKVTDNHLGDYIGRRSIIFNTGEAPQLEILTLDETKITATVGSNLIEAEMKFTNNDTSVFSCSGVVAQFRDNKLVGVVVSELGISQGENTVKITLSSEPLEDDMIRVFIFKDIISLRPLFRIEPVTVETTH